jgi:deoxyadenosine/deoxycytidine kinase
VTARLVSIVGPPAVGKTTLSERLAEALPARLIREDYRGNPFIQDAYAGKAEAQLPAQLYFLVSRTGQLSVASAADEGLDVSDYGFCQDRIYARVRLSEQDYRLYDRLARRVERLVRPPDVLVHLDASEAELLRRIEQRGRAFEKAMTASFLARMRGAYNEAVAGSGCPAVRVDAEAADVRDAALAAELAERIRGRLGR